MLETVRSPLHIRTILWWKPEFDPERNPELYQTYQTYQTYQNFFAEVVKSVRLPRKVLSTPRLTCLFAVGILLIIYRTILCQDSKVYIDSVETPNRNSNDDTQNATLGVRKLSFSDAIYTDSVLFSFRRSSPCPPERDGAQEA